MLSLTRMFSFAVRKPNRVTLKDIIAATPGYKYIIKNICGDPIVQCDDMFDPLHVLSKDILRSEVMRVSCEKFDGSSDIGRLVITIGQEFIRERNCNDYFAPPFELSCVPNAYRLIEECALAGVKVSVTSSDYGILNIHFTDIHRKKRICMWLDALEVNEDTVTSMLDIIFREFRNMKMVDFNYDGIISQKIERS